LYSDDGVDPLIKMAVAHYQFEAIHPFPDGNGRTGRVINILYLVEQGLLSIPTLYLSGYLIQNRSEYYQGLRRITETGAWEDWIVYVLEGVEQTAIATKNKILAVREAMLRATERARHEMQRGFSQELIELIFQQPYTRISSLQQAGIAKRDAASEYLRELARLGFLRGAKRGREMLYVNEELLDILTR
jgi:Fic family protein